jgi:hypothetical protein
MFDRCAPAMAVFFCGPTIMAAIFGTVTLLGGTPVTPEIYGPQVYEIPALAWAGAQCGLGVAGIVGAVRPSRWLAVVGGLGLAFLFIFFAAMALQAGSTGVLLVSMAVATAPICGVFGWWAWSAGHGRN